MRERFICGLDIGTSKIAASIASVDKKGKISLIAIEESMSRGISRGLVTDLALLSNTIQETMRNLGKKSSIKPDDIYAGIKGIHLSCRHSQAIIPLIERDNKIITSLDIKRVNHQARLLGLDLEEEVIHEFPQNYSIDGDGNKVENPLGLYAHKLGVDLFLIIGKVNQIENLIKAINNAGCSIRKLIFSGLAASFVTLEEEEKKSGSCLINIGAGSTEILTFQGGVLRDLEILPIGGINLTERIASNLKIPFELAEELKISYAAATTKDIEGDEDILVKKSSFYNPIRRRDICLAVEPQVNSLIDSIKERIDNSAFRKFFNSGVVITGGTSLLYGFLEQLESRLFLPVRLAKIKQSSLPSTKGPIYATTIGLLYFGIHSFLSNGSLFNKGKAGAGRFVNRIAELYHEYF
ncbi:MAG: cell division protein FtsA [Candidatus Omnitrophota bacterium]|nr:cell division protein FtsA [Candidatus Omnitrophota bacterium]